MLAGLKYQGRFEVGDALAMLIPGHEHDATLAGSVVVPMALHRRREQRRGYNQADLIARPFARRERLEYRPEWLRRIRHTASQVTLSAAARRRNLRGAFVASPHVSGRSICLVDDVITTGSTLAAATLALLDAGASRVICRVAARAEPGRRAPPAQAYR